MGSNPIWGSDFFRVLQTFNLSCDNDNDNDGNDNDNDNDNQPYLVRVTLNSKADKPVALKSGSNDIRSVSSRLLWNYNCYRIFLITRRF